MGNTLLFGHIDKANMDGPFCQLVSQSVSIAYLFILGNILYIPTKPLKNINKRYIVILAFQNFDLKGKKKIIHVLYFHVPSFVLFIGRYDHHNSDCTCDNSYRCSGKFLSYTFN